MSAFVTKLAPSVSRSTGLCRSAAARRAAPAFHPHTRAFTSSPALKFAQYDEAGKKFEAHVAQTAANDAPIDPNMEIPLKTDRDIYSFPKERKSKRTLALFSMTDKVCVVTGAARGLGNLMARTFIESGSSTLVIVDLNQEDAERAAKEATDWFVAQGEALEGELTIKGYGCDVSNEESVTEVFQNIRDTFGKIDCLVTAAGIVENYPAFDYPTPKINKLFDINFNGTFFCAREAAKHMVEVGNKGSIVMVGSMSSSIVNVPQPQMPYNASKAAVRHMAATLAVEWAPKGIRVNCLSPGYMATALTKQVLAKEPVMRDTWVSLTPQGRIGEPEDLKGAVIYLASDASAFTTGVDLKVDGGYCVL